MLQAALAAGLALLLVGSAGLLGDGGAWGQAAKKGEPAKKGEQPKAPAAANPPMPNANQLAILVQTAVVALSQANLTGNYTVLHALGAPDFQQANPPEKLAQLFANTRKTNLTPVILYSPTLMRQPEFDDKGMLRLTGYYKTAPQQVMFDLLYQPVSGQWRLYGISVGFRAPPQEAPAVSAAPDAKPAPFSTAVEKAPKR